MSASLTPASPKGISPTADLLIRLAAEANVALLRGDAQRYCAVVDHSDDFLLFSPFGGAPTRGADITPERVASMGRFFRNGTFSQEVLQAYISADMAVLALIERAHVEVGGLPAQDWALRVTLVWRRDGDRWQLVHRHADPLVAGISLQHAAVLGRGEAI